MKRLKFWMVLFVLSIAACGGDDSVDTESQPTCTDGVQNQDEEGVDCGGVCRACEVESSCEDGEQNGDETGVDCGGSCDTCEAQASCEDGVQNGDETGVDCGGSCSACMPEPTCNDGIQNGAEAQVDCGGACEPCPNCEDGVQNGSETGIDCGGTCDRCRLEAPQGWVCSGDAFDDLRCDCGCGVVDADCASAAAQVCEGSACTPTQQISDNDNSQCVALPEMPGNLSFESTPGQAGDIPDWTVVRRDGTSDTYVVGPAQTTAPDGSRALYLTSSYRLDLGSMMGFPSPVEVESALFVPTGTTCQVTIAMGDSNSSGGNSEWGLIRVEAEGAARPLNVLAEISIDTRGAANSVVPTVDTYQDVVLDFTHDGSFPLKIVIIGDSNIDTKAFHVDNVRIDCT